MARGNAREVVFVDDTDCQHFLNELQRVVVRLDWQVLAYCLMPNHYHLLLRTPDATLARGMRDVNGSYAQGFNRRHARVGHVFQGRYKAFLIEKGAYLLEVIRYIARNPVSAGLCGSPDEWAWSSHRAVLGRSSVPPCLDASAVLTHFGPDVPTARTRYTAFVAVGGPVTDDGWMHPVVVGGEAFIATAVHHHPQPSRETPRRHRAPCPLAAYERQAGNRNEAITLAYASGLFSLSEIGRHFGLHYSTVSRVCRSLRRGDR